MQYWCELEHYEEVSVDSNGNHRDYGTSGFDEYGRYYFDLRVSYIDVHTNEDYGTSSETSLEEIEIMKVEVLRWDSAGHELIQEIDEADVPEDVLVEMKKRVVDDFRDGVLTPQRVQEIYNV